MNTKIAKEKVWKTNKNELVEDGHKDAAHLVARKGELVPESRLEGLTGASKFFSDSKATVTHVPSASQASAAPAAPAKKARGKKNN
jgi:hypothetical protein